MDMLHRFLSIGEYAAAGLYEEPERDLFYRKSLGLRRYYERLPVFPYNGEYLYPSGANTRAAAVAPNYMYGLDIDKKALSAKDAELCAAFAQSEFYQYQSSVPWQHTVAGNMWTHSMPNYERIAKEGFDSYLPRIEKIHNKDMRDGLKHLLAGIRDFRDRSLAYLKEAHARPELIAAMEKVPFQPVTNLYEAIVCWNFVLYLDGVDNLGDITHGLSPYYAGEDMVPVLRNLFENLDCNEGYSMQMGMADDAAEEALTIQCLKVAHGMRRPMMELFVDENTSKAVWEEAVACIRSGASSPSFYNKRLYKQGLLARFPQLTEEDVLRTCGGGCTETMISGLSNVGSLDAGINLSYCLRNCIDKKLRETATFEEFYRIFLDDVHAAALDVMQEIANSQLQRAKLDPVPMRTLLIDDCIDCGLDYNAGGARYMWSDVSYAGIINAIDGLLVLRDWIYRDKVCTAQQLIDALDSGDEAMLKKMRDHDVRFGIDNKEANALAHDLTKTIFGYLKEREPGIGFGFLPASIQFRAYDWAGSYVNATPDGRGKCTPLADSLTAIFAKDTEGPTALIKSVTSMELKEALGTPVFNLTINPKLNDALFVSLIKSYMKLDGMQVQITCVSRELLEEAYADPEKHRNLVVRVGGYSEYFCRLTDDLKRKVIERTIYE